MTLPALRTAGVAVVAAAALCTPAVAASTAGADRPASARLVTADPDGLFELSATGWPDPEGIPGEAWIVVDVASGQVLAARRETELRPPASTTKLLTALAVARRTSGDELVTVSDDAARQAGASTGLRTGDVLRLDDLLALLLIRSGNDAAVALAEHTAGSEDAFADLLAQEAAVLGLDGIRVEEPHGLDDRNRLSARDLAVIGRAVLADTRLRPLVAAPTWTLSTGQVIANRNLVLERYPDATGLKTGMTRAAGWSLVASARRGTQHLVAVVLGGASEQDRLTAVTMLLDHGFDAFTSAPPPPGLRLRTEAAWLDVAAPLTHVVVPVGATVGHTPTLPVEPAAPDIQWRWGGPAGEGATRLATTLRSGTATAATSPVSARPEQPSAGSTGALGAWVAGRVHAAFRAATVSGLWGE